MNSKNISLNLGVVKATPFLFMKSRYIYIFISSIFLFACVSKSEEKVITLFSSLSSEQTGIEFSNDITEDYNNFFGVFNYAYNGAGVAVGDINNDGLDDVYFVGNQQEDKLYLNKGDFKFQDISVSAGLLPKKAWHNGVTMVDVNADGFLDIYVTVGGWKEEKSKRKNILYINQKNNTFKEQADFYGLADTGFSLMATFFDADNDNDLDVYVTNRPNKFFLQEQTILKGKQLDKNPFRDKLYINNNGSYQLQDYKKGLKENLGYGLGVVAADLNNDHLTDIYVGNDFYENDYFYANKGNGNFEQSVEKITNHLSFYTMGVDVVDFNNDGFEDIYTLDMLPNDYERSKTTMAPMDIDRYNYQLKNGFYNQYMHNVLNINNGNGFFSDVAELAGVSKTDWSWACLGADFDNDGDNDLLVTNGYKRDVWDNDANLKSLEHEKKPFDRTKGRDQIIKELVSFYPSIKLKNYIYENKTNLNFKNKADDWGLDQTSFSNGAAYSDFDNDGDLDIVINNVDDKAFIYRNNSESLKSYNFLKLKLKGPKSNPSGLGAKLTLYHGDSIQYKEVKVVRGYLSSVSPVIHFGLGKLNAIDSLKVHWNDGKEQILNEITINKEYQIKYMNAQHKVGSLKETATVFSNITDKVFKEPLFHVENEYNDYKDQILLPYKLSVNGPAIAVGDINKDGKDDFYFGGNHKTSGKLYIQTQTNFEEVNVKLFKNDSDYEDTNAEFVDIDNDGDLDLYVVSGGNEFVKGHSLYQDRFYLNDGKGGFTKKMSLPKIDFPGSKVLFEDYDRDGDLDVFVFGRHMPKKYPSPQKSIVFKNINGILTDITASLAPEFKTLGMVTDAVFSDINGDQVNELFVVGEWMGLSVFKFEGDKLRDISEAVGLKNTEGWWNKINASDIDNDGDIDFVVGNLGLNSKYKASIEKPFYVFAADYDKNGTQDIFLAKPYKNKIVPLRGKECSTEQLPGLKEKFSSYSQFAQADLFEIIGDRNNSKIKYESKLFESVVLKNDKGVFSIEKLPIQAQFSTINGIAIDDFDKDGVKDILFAGNRFEMEIETTRSDASIGGVLLGDKNGKFEAMSVNNSGFFVPKNVKNINLIKVKGQKCVLIGVNDNSLKLFKFVK